MTNRLAESSSSYLRSAAHQPIDWYEFGEEAFEKARELDRPILLDIGAVWCHWCHVIDRESYENPEIAALINAHFVAVKVDRDQRPDVDARYQQVVSSMTGQGGWPLTAFLTYDGRLIYGGTYFPPETMKNLLEQIHGIYHQRKAEIFAPQQPPSGEDIVRQIEQMDRLEKGHHELNPSSEDARNASRILLETIVDFARRHYDASNGGFGTTPKFPHFSTLEFLIATAHRTEDAGLRTMIETTLAKMADGGVYDQIAGGFHRYSVDDHWHVPHFEKMAYDNAEALKVYAQAYRLTGNAYFREIAEGIIGWVNALLSDPERGGFFASQDADIDLHDDGDHFTWSPDELREILTPQEQSAISLYYDITAQGDMHHAKGRNVLRIVRNAASVAGEMGIPTEQAEQLIASAKAKMLARRNVRKMPYIDQSLYVNWNGMMLAGYFEAADLLEDEAARGFASRTLDRMLSEFYVPGEKVLHSKDVDGFLEDYAWLALACVKGYQSTEDARYLEAAKDIADLMCEYFADRRMGGFHDIRETESSLALLKMKRKPVEDSPSSSPNAVALQVLWHLHYATENEAYKTTLEKGLVFLIHQHGEYGLYVSALGVAAHYVLHPPVKIELTGNDASLKQHARRLFHPGKLIVYKPDEAVAEARVCIGTHCLAPAKSPEELDSRLPKPVAAAQS